MSVVCRCCFSSWNKCQCPETNLTAFCLHSKRLWSLAVTSGAQRGALAFSEDADDRGIHGHGEIFDFWHLVPIALKSGFCRTGSDSTLIAHYRKLDRIDSVVLVTLQPEGEKTSRRRLNINWCKIALISYYLCLPMCVYSFAGQLGKIFCTKLEFIDACMTHCLHFWRYFDHTIEPLMLCLLYWQWVTVWCHSFWVPRSCRGLHSVVFTRFSTLSSLIRECTMQTTIRVHIVCLKVRQWVSASDHTYHLTVIKYPHGINH